MSQGLSSRKACYCQSLLHFLKDIETESNATPPIRGSSIPLCKTQPCENIWSFHISQIISKTLSPSCEIQDNQVELKFYFFLSWAVLNNKRWHKVLSHLFKDNYWSVLWLLSIHVESISCQNPGQNLTTAVREQYEHFQNNIKNSSKFITQNKMAHNWHLIWPLIHGSCSSKKLFTWTWKDLIVFN